MNFHVDRRLLFVAAVLGAVGLFAVGFFVALGVRAVVAGPGAAPAAAPAWVGHTYDQIVLPGGTWTDLDADFLDGLDSSDLQTTSLPWSAITSKPAGFADDIDDDVVGGLSCANGEIAKWDGSAWQCAADESGAGGDFWSLTGNSGTTPGTHFVGTTDNQALELRVNSARALRLEPDAASPNLIGGYSGNSVTDGVVGATIGGGGEIGWIGYTNRVTDDLGTVGGGRGNQAGDNAGTTNNAWLATVAGGDFNTAGANHATVGGGWENMASGSSATVGGGGENSASGIAATVGGGGGNMASGSNASIGGGRNNTASADRATVAGGEGNTASNQSATVGGGQGNIADEVFATVAGGAGNTAGDTGTVGGGSHNIASGGSATVGGGGENDASGLVATIGGGGYNTASGGSATVGGGRFNAASADYATVGGGQNNSASGLWASVDGGANNSAAGDYSFAAGRRAKIDALHDGSFLFADWNDFDFDSAAAKEFAVRSTGGARFVSAIDGTGAPWAGVQLVSGGSAWSSLSDRNLKENFTPVDGQEVLASLAGIPIATWNYKAQEPSIRHMGPVAQDFYAAFGLGESDTAISTVDPDGVALAAIQGLYELSQEQAERIDALEARVAALEGGAPLDDDSAGPLASIMPTGWLLLGGLVLGGLVLVQRRRAVR